MLNVFKKKQNGELTQITKPATKIELNVVKANQRIAELEAKATAPASPIVTAPVTPTAPTTPQATPAYEPTYNGKTVKQLMQEAETSSLIRHAKKEVDTKKKAQLVTAILKDPRMFKFGQTSTVEQLEAEQLYLAEKDAAQRKYDDTLAAQKQKESLKRTWEDGARVCNSTVYYILKRGYYLCFDTNGEFERVFIKISNDNGRGWMQLVKTGLAGCKSSVGNCPGATPSNKAEFTKLLEVRPTLDDLCLIYTLKINDNVTITEEQVVPVWD